MHHSLRRSIPAFLATASSPFFSMVFNALVDNRSLRKRFPASHQTLLYCKFTNCNFFVLWAEKEILFALFAFLPVKGQTLPENYKQNHELYELSKHKLINITKYNSQHKYRVDITGYTFFLIASTITFKTPPI